MEIWDIYDSSRKLTGSTVVRGDSIPSGGYHIVVTVMTMGADGRMLVTQRDKCKDFGMLWEFTGGSAISGEDSRTAAVRELREETGLTATKESLRFLYTEKGKTYFHDFYLNIRDKSGEDIILQEGETIGSMWLSLEELKRRAANGGFLCGPCEKRFSEVIDILDEAAEELLKKN